MRRVIAFDERRVARSRAMLGPMDDVVARVESALAERGFDLVSPFRVARYNARVEPEHALPNFGRADALGLLVANSRAFWPFFLAAYDRDSSLRAHPHPLDTYTERAVTEVATGLRCELRFAHEGPPRLVAFQKLAEVAGLAHLSPSYLSVHPVHGPWIGLRAAIVLDADAGGLVDVAPPDPCDRCEKPCLTALATALAAGPASQTSLRAHYERWVAVRDACPVGRTSRYTDAQTEYHYTKRRHLLLGDDAVTLGGARGMNDPSGGLDE